MTAPERPHIVVIAADTLRPAYLGCYGNAAMHTPNLDRLAAQSIRFTRAHPEALPTIPTRRTVHGGRRVYPFADYRPVPWDNVYLPGWQPMARDEPTVAEALDAAGYHTGFVADVPHYFVPGMNFTRGFRQWQFVRGQAEDRLGAEGAADPALLPRYRGRIARRHLVNVRPQAPEEEWPTARTFRWAQQFLEQNAGGEKPLYLYVDSFTPHETWEAPLHYYDRYGRPRSRFNVPYGPGTGRAADAAAGCRVRCGLLLARRRGRIQRHASPPPRQFRAPCRRRSEEPASPWTGAHRFRAAGRTSSYTGYGAERRAAAEARLLYPACRVLAARYVGGQWLAGGRLTTPPAETSAAGPGRTAAAALKLGRHSATAGCLGGYAEREPGAGRRLAAQAVRLPCQRAIGAPQGPTGHLAAGACAGTGTAGREVEAPELRSPSVRRQRTILDLERDDRSPSAPPVVVHPRHWSGSSACAAVATRADMAGGHRPGLPAVGSFAIAPAHPVGGGRCNAWSRPATAVGRTDADAATFSVLPTASRLLALLANGSPTRASPSTADRRWWIAAALPASCRQTAPWLECISGATMG